MSKFFSAPVLRSAHRVLWNPEKDHFGRTPIRTVNTSTKQFRYFRRGSEMVISQNLAKDSSATRAFTDSGVKTTWVIDSKSGYIDKITESSSGRIAVTHLQGSSS